MLATYPLHKDFDKTAITFRLMTPKDESAMIDFSGTLPESDIIYLRMDITQPEVIEEWVNNIKIGRTITILVEEKGELIGYGSLHYNQLDWTRHIGEIRFLVDAKVRGLGVGRALMEQLAEIAEEKGLARVIVQIPATQPKVRKMVELLGYEPQALLTDWLKDRHNRPHDLIIMSKNLTQ